MKSARQTKILEIIASTDVQTQEQLLQELQQAGFMTTQATVSRDIRDLQITKELSPNGGYRYVCNPREATNTFSARLHKIFRECVTSVDWAQNLVVIKTMPGLAGAAGSAMDGMNLSYMLGTLAGDDTVVMILKDSASAAGLCMEIRKMLD